MENQTSSFALVAAIGGIVGGVIQYVLNLFFGRYITSARLKMALLSDAYTNYKTESEGSTQILRLRVWNECTFVAKNCRVFLASMERVKNIGEYLNIRETLQLPWELRGKAEYTSVDLPKGVVFDAAVLEVLVKIDQFDTPTWVITRKQIKLKTQPGHMDYENFLKEDVEYMLKLMVTAENAEPYFLEVNVLVQFNLEGRIMNVLKYKGYYLSRIMNAVEEFKISWHDIKST